MIVLVNRENLHMVLNVNVILHPTLTRLYQIWFSLSDLSTSPPQIMCNKVLLCALLLTIVCTALVSADDGQAQ